MGFKVIGKYNKEGRFRFEMGIEKNNGKQLNTPSIGSIVDVVCQPDISAGYIGIGTVHHIAWRAASDDHQLDLRKSIIKEAGLNPTPVIDRTYFHSVYFREPGGILFEIATDPPGFTIDESPENLGKKLMLPDWLESMREKLERVLPPIKMPTETAEDSKKKGVS